jgi:DNA-binding protein YbaB
MLDNLKKINELRKLKNSLKSEFSEVEKEGVKVKVNGEMKIQEIEISSELTKKKQEELLVSCINDALRKMQMKAVQKMSGLKN